MSSYTAKIGLEIHAQLLTRTKLFCACPAAYGDEPNTNVCPVCLGLPGALPVVNRRAVELAVKTGLALQCRIARRSVFARKNYFYPDCPKNYQITQYDSPLCADGYLKLESTGKRVRIRRVHLEEDAGRLLHAEKGNASHIDFNRAGIPLVEIVTAPDIESPHEASEFVKSLRSILRYLDVCDGNMEEGSLRCDTNVSVARHGSGGLGVSTEIKNLNSFGFIEDAVAFEIGRQTALLEDGGTVARATLLWDDGEGRCVVMRTKEETEDYRYFPEPDLPPLEVADSLVQRLRGELPELPAARARRLVSEYGLPRDEALAITGSRALADYFEETARMCDDARQAGHWVVGEVLRALNEKGIGATELTVTPANLARLIAHVRLGRINLATAKAVFRLVADTGKDPDAVIAEGDLGRIADERELRRAVARVLDAHPREVAAYLGGKEQLFTYFVGEAMKETCGRADPGLLRKLLEQALAERSRS